MQTYEREFLTERISKIEQQCAKIDVDISTRQDTLHLIFAFREAATRAGWNSEDTEAALDWATMDASMSGGHERFVENLRRFTQ